MDKGSGAVRRVPFWRSLQTKFALTYIVIVAAVLILLNTYPLVVSEKLAYQSKQASMLNQASVLASALATGPEALTAEGATRTVELLRSSLGVTRVVVTDPNGLVLCDFQDGVGRTDTAGRYALFWELVTALRGNNVFRSEYGDGAFRSWAAVPITYRSMTQGAVYLYEYDAEQGALLQGIQTNLRFISIVICMVSLVMGVVFSKALTRRIAQLLRGIHTVREGEYSHRVSVRGGDELSRLADEFNELTGHLVDATMGPVRQAMSDAGLKASDLSKVLMVGGSSRIPAVVEAVKKFTGSEPFKGINPDECVAMGAALQAGVLTGDVKGLLLLDVTPLSLGIETMGGVMTKLIERNTTIPAKKSQVFTTAADNQTSVEVHVLQGEREMAQYNKTLGRFHLDGIAPARRGVPQIEVTFDIDANGIVNVSAKDLGTGKEQHITITSSSNMSKEDIEKAVKEAEQYAAQDKKLKEEVEVRNQADQMVYQSEKTLSEMGDKIPADDKSKVQAGIDKLKEVLKGTDTAAIKTATDELTQAFYAVSEKLYQQANPQGAQGGAQQQAGPDAGAQQGQYYDADYKVVDDDENNKK